MALFSNHRDLSLSTIVNFSGPYSDLEQPCLNTGRAFLNTADHLKICCNWCMFLNSSNNFLKNTLFYSCIFPINLYLKISKFYFIFSVSVSWKLFFFLQYFYYFFFWNVFVYNLLLPPILKLCLFCQFADFFWEICTIFLPNDFCWLIFCIFP